jgi:hypothetical protein
LTWRSSIDIHGLRVPERDSHLTVRFFSYAFSENLGVIAQFKVYDAPFICRHRFKGLFAPSLYRLVSHAPAELA